MYVLVTNKTDNFPWDFPKIRSLKNLTDAHYDLSKKSVYE